MRVTIREARVGDYDALCVLFAQGDAYHMASVPHVFRPACGPPRTLDFIRQSIAQESATILIATHESEVVGLVHVQVRQAPDVPIMVPRRYGYIESMIVLEQFRGQGVGSALLEHAHRWLLQRGISEVELNVWDFNEPAIRLYEEFGYETVSRRMRRTLP